MKTIRYSTIWSAAALLLLCSCVKDDLVNTPHPDKGAVVVSADFSQHSEGIALPADYMLALGGETVAASIAGTFCHPVLFDPGTYPLTAFTSSGKMTVTGETVAINTVPDGTLEPLPGYLFTARQEIEVIRDDTVSVVLPMTQRMRDLHFAFTVTGGDCARIGSVAGTLAGVAGTFDLVTQRPTDSDATHAAANATSPLFTREGDKITASARLLGVAGDSQTLTLLLTFTDGASQTVTKDLTELLADFNEDMLTPLTLKAYLNTPVEAGFSATVTDWEAVANEDVDLH